MTTLREAAQQALEALEMAAELQEDQRIDFKKYGLKQDEDIGVKYEEAITSLRKALAQQEQEPGQAEREKVAHWMRSMGYATVHGDTMEDLLDHLGTQIAEGLEVEVLMEREACAKVCEDASKPREGEMHSDAQWAGLVLSAAIRARSKT